MYLLPKKWLLASILIGSSITHLCFAPAEEAEKPEETQTTTASREEIQKRDEIIRENAQKEAQREATTTQPGAPKTIGDRVREKATAITTAIRNKVSAIFKPKAAEQSADATGENVATIDKPVEAKQQGLTLPEAPRPKAQPIEPQSRTKLSQPAQDILNDQANAFKELIDSIHFKYIDPTMLNKMNPTGTTAEQLTDAMYQLKPDAAVKVTETYINTLRETVRLKLSKLASNPSGMTVETFDTIHNTVNEALAKAIQSFTNRLSATQPDIAIVKLTTKWPSNNEVQVYKVINFKKINPTKPIKTVLNTQANGRTYVADDQYFDQYGKWIAKQLPKEITTAQELYKQVKKITGKSFKDLNPAYKEGIALALPPDLATPVLNDIKATGTTKQAQSAKDDQAEKDSLRAQSALEDLVDKKRQKQAAQALSRYQ